MDHVQKDLERRIAQLLMTKRDKVREQQKLEGEKTRLTRKIDDMLGRVETLDRMKLHWIDEEPILASQIASACAKLEQHIDRKERQVLSARRLMREHMVVGNAADGNNDDTRRTRGTKRKAD